MDRNLSRAELATIPTSELSPVEMTRLDVVEVAKRVRAEIKAAQKAGGLPEGKIAVTTERFAGGCSLSIRVVNVEAQMFNPERVAIEVMRPHDYWNDDEYRAMPRFTTDGQNIMAALKTIVGKYHRDESDLMTDYFNVNFYLHVDVSSEQEKKERASAPSATVTEAPAEDDEERVPGFIIHGEDDTHAAGFRF